MFDIAGKALILLLALTAPLAVAQQIYKTVDEDGNVVYTDQKPSEDAEPIPLPELTVVDPVEIGDPSAARAAGDSIDPVRLEFTIESPMPDEVIVNTGYRLDVRLALDIELPSGVEVVYRIDGREWATSRSLTATLEEIERGPHTLTAELRSGDGRVLATTETISFFMRQQSALFRRPG